MCLAKLAKLAKLANFRIVFLVFVRRLTIVFLRHDSAKSKQASSLLSLLRRLTIVFLLLRRHSSNKFGSALLSFVG